MDSNARDPNSHYAPMKSKAACGRQVDHTDEWLSFWVPADAVGCPQCRQSALFQSDMIAYEVGFECDNSAWAAHLRERRANEKKT